MSPSAPTEHSSSAPSQRSPGDLWSQISDPSTWATWNTAVDQLTLDGPFVSGTRGRLTPTAGDPLDFVLVDVAPGEGYTSETTIASTVTLRTTTRIVADDRRGDGAMITQLAQLIGPAAEHFAPSFGDALITSVDRTVQILAGPPS